MLSTQHELLAHDSNQAHPRSLMDLVLQAPHHKHKIHAYRLDLKHKTTFSSLRLEAFVQVTRTVSLELGFLAWVSALQWHSTNSRLGEAFSLGRDHFSPKTKVSRLAAIQAETQIFAISRLGETCSPKRDDLSPKSWLSAWARCFSKTRAKSLLLLPRRGLLAWVKITYVFLVHAHKHQKQYQTMVHLLPSNLYQRANLMNMI